MRSAIRVRPTLQLRRNDQYVAIRQDTIRVNVGTAACRKQGTNDSASEETT